MRIMLEEILQFGVKIFGYRIENKRLSHCKLYLFSTLEITVFRENPFNFSTNMNKDPNL